MKICFFNDMEVIGGGERWVLRTCQHMRSLGHQPSVICPYTSELHRACLQQEIEVFTYYLDGSPGHPPEQRIFEYLRLTSPDFLYCTIIGRFCEVRLLEQLVSKLRRSSTGCEIRIILKTGLPPMEGLSPEYYGAGAGPAVRRLHVVSASIKDAFIHWQPQMDNGFIEVFYEGADRQLFNKDRHSSADSRRLWQLGPDQIVISCIARLDGIKGQSVLLRAVPQVIAAYPNAIFLFAGEGKDRDMLEILNEDLGLTRCVRFLGNTDHITDLLAATDILCHPSLNEGIPNAVVEAMTMSVPIVASDLPGIREIIDHRKTGYLVRPNDVGCLTAALLETIRDKHNRTQMARQAERTVAGPFNFAANTDRLLARLQAELLAAQKSPHIRTAPKDWQRHGSIAVLFIMHEIRLGGEETELGILPRYLDRKRFNMSVLSCYPSREQAPVLERLRYYDVPVDTTCYAMPDEEDKIAYIAALIKARDIGIVVACQDTRLVYEVFKRLSPYECKLIEHGGVMEDVDRIPKQLSCRYIGVSAGITQAAAALMRTPEEAVYIPSMVDRDEYDDQEWAGARALVKEWLHETLLKPFGYGEDVCVIVFVGRLDPKKHAEDLIRAARLLETDCPEAFFLIVGGEDSFAPEYGQRLVSNAADLMTRGRLAFTGTRSDIAGILSASDILVLPSTGEGMAHVINEAGAAGLAVVATDDGAASEQLEAGRCGRLVGQRNIVGLAEALKDLIRDKQQRRLLGQRLKEKVAAEYDARVVIAKWNALFESVAAELHRSPHRTQRL
jgi:glycosyltransferase involved in cell wall biosynthesis